MKIKYKIIETKEFAEDSEPYIAYGLSCSFGSESAEIGDISPNREAVERLADLLEREEVEPVHLFDVLYDMLASGSFR